MSQGLLLAVVIALLLLLNLASAVGWPAGELPQPSSAQQLQRLLDDNLGFSLGSLLLLGLLGYYVQAWWRFGRDPQSGPIIV